jgi:hypothetical protein
MSKNYIYGYTESNPYIIEDYPYGFRLRTTARYYIETVSKKGDRVVFQTLNPTTGKWNKPKKSTYSAIIILWLDENNHIKSSHLSAGWASAEQIEAFAIHLEKFNAEQLKMYKYVKAVNNTQKYIKFEIVNTTAYTAEQHAENDRKQAETNSQLQKVFSYELNKVNREISQ